MSQKYTISKFIFAYKGSRIFKINKSLIFNHLTQKLTKTSFLHLIVKIYNKSNHHFLVSFYLNC
nr:MAG TPA: hypothetical protein [Herelleviridae sp.]DAP94245.1 MAG TPA: hypothetical protein [Herelleviridae sp.]